MTDGAASTPLASGAAIALSAPRVRVIGGGVPQDIAVTGLVAGDLAGLRAGRDRGSLEGSDPCRPG